MYDMITDPITLSQVRALVHQIRLTEQNGDVEGAAALAWELANTLQDGGVV